MYLGMNVVYMAVVDQAPLSLLLHFVSQIKKLLNYADDQNTYRIPYQVFGCLSGGAFHYKAGHWAQTAKALNTSPVFINYKHKCQNGAEIISDGKCVGKAER